LPYGSTITYQLSSPEQVAAGGGVALLSNDSFNVGAATLELLLGYGTYNGLLVEAVAGTADGGAGYVVKCLFPPGNAPVQQQQLVKIKAVLLRWVKEAKEEGNPLLLGWLGVVMGQVHPDPEERLTPAQAAERLKQLRRRYGEENAQLAAVLGGA
jgi:hypothetical protein